MVLNNLYKKTALQSNFNAIDIAPVIAAAASQPVDERKPLVATVAQPIETAEMASTKPHAPEKRLRAIKGSKSAQGTTADTTLLFPTLMTHLYQCAPAKAPSSQPRKRSLGWCSPR